MGRFIWITPSGNSDTTASSEATDLPLFRPRTPPLSAHPSRGPRRNPHPVGGHNLSGTIPAPRGGNSLPEEAQQPRDLDAPHRWGNDDRISQVGANHWAAKKTRIHHTYPQQNQRGKHGQRHHRVDRRPHPPSKIRDTSQLMAEKLTKR